MLSLTHQNPAPRGKRSRYSWGQTNPNSYILNDMPSLKDTHRQRGKNWKKTLSDLRVVQSLLNHFLFYIFQISNNPDWYYFANQKQFSNMLKVISQGSANRSSFLSTSPLFLRPGPCGCLTLHPPQEWLVLVSARLPAAKGSERPWLTRLSTPCCLHSINILK